MYFAKGTEYLGPIEGTNPDPVTGAVGFNENATLPFEVCANFMFSHFVRMILTVVFSHLL